MEYLTGKDYADRMCETCCAAIDQAHMLISEFGIELYADDPEGPCMMAYDKGWFCNGYHGCKQNDPEEPEEPKERLWVIAIWKSHPKQDEFLPLAMTKDFWPVQGGIYDAIAEQLGKEWRVASEPLLRVGGLHWRRGNLDVSLVCLDAFEWKDDLFFRDLVNPVMLLPNAEIDPKDWGLE